MKSRTFFSLVAAVAAAAVLAAGCGKAPSRGPQGLELYEAAQERLLEAESFRMTGITEMSVAAGSASYEGPQMVRLPAVEEVERRDGLRIKVTMDTSEMLRVMGIEEGDGATAEAYLDGGRLYVETDGAWYFEDHDPSSPGAGFQGRQVLTPEGMAGAMAAAQSVEVVGADGARTGFRGNLAEEYFGPVIEALRHSLAALGVEPSEDLHAAFSGELEVEIDAASGEVVRFVRVTRARDLDLGHGALMTLEVREAFDLSGYGEVFDLRLPEAARGASPLPGSASGE